MDKATHCCRYESIRCSSCMSLAHVTPPPPPPTPPPPPSTPPPPPPSPISRRPHPSLPSLQDVYALFKWPLECCLRESVLFINFVTAAPTQSAGCDSCKKCRRLRAAHKASCADCHTKMNTRRNTLLGLEALPHYDKTRVKPKEVECSQAFVDHLLHLDSSHPPRGGGRGGVDLCSGYNTCSARMPRSSTPELIRVTKSSYSLSSDELGPVSAQRRPRSDGSCPADEKTGLDGTPRHPDDPSQATRGTMLVATTCRHLRVPKKHPPPPLTATQQFHVHKQRSSRSRGEDCTNVRPIDPRPRLSSSGAQQEITSRSSEGCSPATSPATHSDFPTFFTSLSSPSSASKGTTGAFMERKHTSSSNPPLYSSSPPASPSTSISSPSFLDGRLEEGYLGAGPRHTTSDKHAYDNPLFRDY